MRLGIAGRERDSQRNDPIQREGLHPCLMRLSEQPIWPHHQSGDEQKTGRHGAEPSAEAGIQIARRQAFNKANEHRGDDRSDAPR